MRLEYIVLQKKKKNNGMPFWPLKQHFGGRRFHSSE